MPLMLSSWSLDDLDRSPLNGMLTVASRTDSTGDPFMALTGGGGGVGLFIRLLLGLPGVTLDPVAVELSVTWFTLEKSAVPEP